MEALLRLTQFVADELAEKRIPADGNSAFEQRIDAVGNGRLRRLFEFCGDVGRDVVLLALTAYLMPDGPVAPEDVTIETAAAFYPEPISYSCLRDCWDRLELVFDLHNDPNPFFRRICMADQRLIGWLCGDDRPDERLKDGSVRLLHPDDSVHVLFTDEPVLEPLTRAMSKGVPVQLTGPQGRGRRLLAAHGAQVAQRNLVLADISAWLRQNRSDYDRLSLLLRREAVLNNAGLCLAGLSAPRAEEPPSALEPLLQCLRPLSRLPRLGLPVVLCCDPGLELIPCLPNWGYIERMELPPFTRVQRIALWKGYAQENGLGTSVDCTDAGSRYRLNAGQIAATARRLAHLAPEDRTSRAISEACGVLLPRPPQGTIRRVETQLTFDDLKLLPEQRQTLLNVCAHVRYRHRVYDEWGLDSRYPYGRSVSVLMVGPPGTGKTMAAHVLSGMIGMPLYQIDLSQVVDKYIGETEKRLEQIFDTAERTNVILFFDEADSIFGKRSEVNDAKDKYANTEVSYILQRIEQYDGIVILATNYKRNIDEAFMRRMRYLLEFQIPSKEMRLELWKACFATETPVEDVDFEYLARQFELAGGSIKNVVLNAAFHAAREKSSITMRHVLEAIRSENFKLGRPMIAQDFAEYAFLMKE
ncbi:ATP-binding protein [uncultured Ruthenibacterium sp.]|uniref:ATP-binding protein n=1 Tax=uncultured Ruthenibacterium sp. TaxID=1905347 RepID=UPI00349EA7B7